jgi:hypothetical protein
LGSRSSQNRRGLGFSRLLPPQQNPPTRISNSTLREIPLSFRSDPDTGKRAHCGTGIARRTDFRERALRETHFHSRGWHKDELAANRRANNAETGISEIVSREVRRTGSVGKATTARLRTARGHGRKPAVTQKSKRILTNIENVRKRLASRLLPLPAPMMTFSRETAEWRQVAIFAGIARPASQPTAWEFDTKTLGSPNRTRSYALLVDGLSYTVHKTWTPERSGGERGWRPTSDESGRGWAGRANKWREAYATG